MTDDPLETFRVLRRHDVPFAVIGGHAVAVHGFPRATEDCDVVFARGPDSEQRLFAALQDLEELEGR